MALPNMLIKTFSRGSVCGVVSVGKGIGDSVEVIAEDDVGAIVEKGQEEKITTEKRLQTYIDAPVERGQKLGRCGYTMTGIW